MEKDLELAAHNFTVFMMGGAVIACAMIGFIIAFIFHYRNKQIQHQKEKAVMKFEYDNALLKTQMEIGEETLKKVSHEIHDNILQRLTLTKINLVNAINNQPEKIQYAHDLLNEALSDLRHMSHMLNGSHVLKMGLESAIRNELELISKSSSITCNFKVDSELESSLLNEQQEIILFRCIQEALNNAVKYAYCSNIEVTMSENEDFTGIHITDNGVGFDSNISYNGLGIISMRDRVGILGGELEIKSVLKQGTTIVFQIPHDSLKFHGEKNDLPLGR
jgi:two-component system NarL family sensor kinase